MPNATLVNLVKVASSTVGTGPVTLGNPAPGFRGKTALINGATYSYSIQQGNDYEYGRGVYTASTGVLTRAPIATSYANNAPIAITSGTQIAFPLLAEDLLDRFAADNLRLLALEARVFGTVASTQFNFPRNSQYVPLLFGVN